jgi:two-component system LytT family response regulator
MAELANRSLLQTPISVLVVDDERLARQKVRALLRSHGDIRIIGEAINGLDALTAITQSRPDLVFLDIQMPDLDGLGVIRALSQEDAPEIIFVTAHNAYMEKAFEVHAIDYLRKPYSNERFSSSLEHARQRIYARRAASHPDAVSPRPARVSAPYVPMLSDLQDAEVDSRIALQDGPTGTWHIVRRDEIDWIGTDSAVGVRVHIGKESYVLRKTLVELERSLDRRVFLRVHRSYIVNAKHIRQVKPLLKGEYAVVLSDGTIIDSGRTYRDVVEAFLHDRANQLEGFDDR